MPFPEIQSERQLRPVEISEDAFNYTGIGIHPSTVSAPSRCRQNLAVVRRATAVCVKVQWRHSSRTARSERGAPVVRRWAQLTKGLRFDLLPGIWRRLGA